MIPLKRVLKLSQAYSTVPSRGTFTCSETFIWAHRLCPSIHPGLTWIHLSLDMRRKCPTKDPEVYMKQCFFTFVRCLHGW